MGGGAAPSGLYLLAAPRACGTAPQTELNTALLPMSAAHFHFIPPLHLHGTCMSLPPTAEECRLL